MAQAWGNDTRIMKATLACFEEASAKGLGEEDCNAVYKVTR
jgi:3-hydroxyisobutyrate dehydrogenase-like beta-hydroxyacid dehydrogenase